MEENPTRKGRVRHVKLEKNEAVFNTMCCRVFIDDEQDFLPTSTSAAEGVIASECDPLNGSGGSNGSGTGTWSPQWGWYVSMTPPQVRQYLLLRERLEKIEPPWESWLSG